MNELEIHRNRDGFEVNPRHAGCVCCAEPVFPLFVGDRAKRFMDCACPLPHPGDTASIPEVSR